MDLKLHQLINLDQLIHLNNMISQNRRNIINLDKEDFDIFKDINEIFRHVKQSAKITTINKTSMGLLELEFKSNNIIRSKAMKFIVKKLLPGYK